MFWYKCLIFDCDNNVKTDNIANDIFCFYNLCSIVNIISATVSKKSHRMRERNIKHETSKYTSI